MIIQIVFFGKRGHGPFEESRELTGKEAMRNDFGKATTCRGWICIMETMGKGVA